MEIYILPQLGTSIYGLSNKPSLYCITGLTKIEEEDLKDFKKPMLTKAMRFGGRIFSKIDGEYYILTSDQFTFTEEQIKAHPSARKFTEEEVLSIADGTFADYKPAEIKKEEIEELPEVPGAGSGAGSQQPQPQPPTVTLSITGNVTGTVGSELTKDIVATLSNDTFTGLSVSDDVLSMIVDADDAQVLADSGLTATVKEVNDTTLTITVTGTPSNAISKKAFLAIPADKLTGAKAVKSATSISVQINNVAAAASTKTSRKTQQQ